MLKVRNASGGTYLVQRMQLKLGVCRLDRNIKKYNNKSCPKGNCAKAQPTSKQETNQERQKLGNKKKLSKRPMRTLSSPLQKHH